MRELTVLFDAQCGFCVRCRWWLAAQPKLLALNFLPKDSPEVLRRWPLLGQLGVEQELVVIADDGGIYWGDGAWIMCMWALERYRPWSYRLAEPGWRSLARQAFAMISKNRSTLSRWSRASVDEQLSHLAHSAGPRCPTC